MTLDAPLVPRRRAHVAPASSADAETPGKPIVGPRSLADLKKGAQLDGDNGSDPTVPPDWLDLARFERTMPFFRRHAFTLTLMWHCSLTIGFSLPALVSARRQRGSPAPSAPRHRPAHAAAAPHATGPRVSLTALVRLARRRGRAQLEALVFTGASDSPQKALARYIRTFQRLVRPPQRTWRVAVPVAVPSASHTPRAATRGRDVKPPWRLRMAHPATRRAPPRFVLVPMPCSAT